MLFTAGLGGVWVIVDIIIIILGKFRDKEGYQLKF